MCTGFYWRNLKNRVNLDELNKEGRIILKWTFNRMGQNALD